MAKRWDQLNTEERIERLRGTLILVTFIICIMAVLLVLLAWHAVEDAQKDLPQQKQQQNNTAEA